MTTAAPHTASEVKIPPPPSGRGLLGLRGMPPADLRAILNLTKHYSDIANERQADEPLLKGLAVANLFFEDSTRTRLSFTLAAQRLGAHVIDLAGQGSSFSKGESLSDTALTVEAMGVHAMVVRAKGSGSAELIARVVKCPVINAGDGTHEHPTQALIDIYTLCEATDRLDSFDLSGMTVVIVGDCASSRVARSNIASMSALGARVVCVGPPGMAPASLRALGCEVLHDLDSIAPEADAIMMLRIQWERHSEAVAAGADAMRKRAKLGSLRQYRELYAMTRRRADSMKPGAWVMHPGPMNRGVEIDQEVADGPRSLILRQVAAGVAVRMAVLARTV